MSTATKSSATAVWAKNGFTADQEREWKASGFTSVQAALVWTSLGLNLNNAIDWGVEAGFTAQDAHDWINDKVTDPDVAIDWSDLDFTPANSRDWRRENFFPQDAADWEDAGFSASEASDWIKAGVDEPSEAVLLCDMGQKPSDYEIGLEEHLMY